MDGLLTTLGMLRILGTNEENEVTTRTLYLFLALGLSVALFDSGRVYGATQAGGSFPSRPVRVNRALAYCAAHPTATSYHATIRGFFVLRLPLGLARTGGAGGFYEQKHALGPLWAADRTPFLQVEWFGHGPSWVTWHWATFRGILRCRMRGYPTVGGTLFVKTWHPFRSHPRG